jgi:hypothetical protein
MHCLTSHHQERVVLLLTAWQETGNAGLLALAQSCERRPAVLNGGGAMPERPGIASDRARAEGAMPELLELTFYKSALGVGGMHAIAKVSDRPLDRT